MANLPSSPNWSPDVYQIETSDAVLGGPDGVINVQARQLAERTVWLKEALEAIGLVASGADSKADEALEQIAVIELASGSAEQNAALAQQYKTGAEAALALALKAQQDAEAARAQADDSATYAFNQAQIAAAKAQQTSADSAAALGAASQILGVLDAVVAAGNAASAELSEIAEAALDEMIPARDATLAAAQTTQQNAYQAMNAETVATEKAAIATQQATLATDRANAAQVARVAAEVARDAAQLSGGVYATIAAGLAATAVGRYFSVPSALNTEYLILYRKDSATVAVEIQRYPSVSGIEYTISNVVHVKSNGNDAYDGSSWRKAVRTIERALAIAWANTAPTLIEWAPEAVVYTNGHLDMPDNCVIKATHRTVFLRPNPGYEKRNVFRMGSGCFLEGVMFEGWELDSMTNPTEGFAVSFRPGAVITRVPYAHKIAVRRIPTWGVVAPPLDRANANPEVGPGGGVVLADGAVCSQYSIFPNIMTWGATPVIPNGIGYCAKNGGLINAVNAVSMWAHKHFLALSGGQIILSSCSTQFGDYSLHAKGSRDIVIPATIGLTAASKDTTAATAVTNNQAALINSMWNSLVAGGYTVGWDTTDETYTRRDAATLLQALAWSLKTGNEQPMVDFAKGLFDTLGQPVFSADKKNAFLFSFTKLKDGVNALNGVSTAARNVVTSLFTALASTISSPVKRKEPSRITAIGHTWTAVMAGVVLTKIPPANNQATIRDSILEENEGVVIASGQDDQGNALFVGGLEINADTGELGGPPFDQAVRRVATRAAIARSF